MAFGISTGTWLTAGLSAAGGLASAYGANKANKMANSQLEAQMQMYYDSPQYKTGNRVSGLLLGGDEKSNFDEEAYLEANPDVADVLNGTSDKYSREDAIKDWGGATAYDHYMKYGEKEGREGTFKNEAKRQGLLDMYHDAIVNAKAPQLSTVRTLAAPDLTLNYTERLHNQLRNKGIF